MQIHYMHQQCVINYHVTVDYISNLDPYGECLYVFVVDIYYPSKLYDRYFKFPILCDQSIPPNDKT